MNVKLIKMRRVQIYDILPEKERKRTIWGGGSRGVMVKAMDCGIVVSECELQSRNYVHFRTNMVGKGMNPLSSQLLG